jgi:putative endopeptidase
MKPLFFGALALSVAASLTLAPLSRADDPTPATHFGAWGVDLTGRDTTLAPGADFYAFANGAAARRLEIPPDRSRYGSFDALQALSEARVRAILETAAADTAAVGDEARIGAFWRAYMDETRADALGDAPIRPELARIRAAATRSQLAALMGASSKSYYGGFFGAGIGVDGKDPDHYAIYLGQAGLSLPDRDYYVEPQFAAQKAAFQAYVAKLLGLIGWPDADPEAAAIVAMESEISKDSWTRADSRDPSKIYNPMSPDELARAAPGFDWHAYLAAADIGGARRLIVAQNTAFPKIAQVFAGAPVETLQAWQAFTVTDAAAPYLSKPFVDAHFEFRNKALSGQPAPKPRWKLAVEAIDGGVGEAVGRLYVAQYFPPPAKAKMEALVGEIRAALKARIERVAWMSDATKAKAVEKLSRLNVKIGYPVKWRDYGALAIRPDDLAGDVERSAAFEWARQVKQLGGPVDPAEWALTPQTVNAYYSPTRNEIVFPAAILQPPFFDPAADPAVNYGAIGAVIGHEMTHGFDDNGRQFDGSGRLTDWWTADDAAKFVAQTRRLGEQYSAFEPIAGAHVKGDLTMGENIADLGGLLLALDAYHASLGGRSAPAVDGLSGDQRLFLGFAQIWRSAIRPDALRRQLVSDPHAPEVVRVNGVVRNVDAWYDTWAIKPGDPLYLAPDQRVRIW